MATNILIRNPSKLNTLKVVQRNLAKDKEGKTVAGQWKNGNVAFLPPGETLDVWLDHTGRAVTIEEMPS